MVEAERIRIDDSFIFEYPCKSNTICEPYVIQFQRGRYRVELWGASGGNGRNGNVPEIRINSGGNGSYVTGDIYIKEPTKFYLYLGGKGSDQSSIDDYTNQASGGWNFGGTGGIDKFDRILDAQHSPPESGAGGGGAVDLRIEYIDINLPNLDDDLLLSSLKSRIIVAGSGGGSVSDFDSLGFPGGALRALNSSKYMFGGTQTQGELGKGQNGLDTENNQGGAGGCGSGYRGAYHNLSTSITNVYVFQFGGSGGSSYISGHPGCISPQYPSNTVANEITPFHESSFYFTNTDMKAGNEYMPDPFTNNEILGHVGNGVCRITFLFKLICQTEFVCYRNDYSISMSIILIGSFKI